MASRIANRWLGFVTALWVQAISGNNYTFANYSVALKAILQLNQVELNNLSVAKDVGKAFGIIGGLLSDFLPPWMILLIGSVEGLVGYGAQWLVVSHRIQPLPYWLMCIVMCLGGNSTTWMNTAVLVTCVRNFNRNRGPVSGILKGYVGLSTAIFTDLCVALFSGDPAHFVLMLAVIPFIICTVAMIFLKPIEPAENEGEEKQETRGFLFLNVVAVILALYLLGFDITTPHSRFISKIFAGFLLVLLAAPIILPGVLLFRLSKIGSPGITFDWWSSVVGRGPYKQLKKGTDIIIPLLRDKMTLPEQEKLENGQMTAKKGQAEEVRVSVLGKDTYSNQCKEATSCIKYVNPKRRPQIGEDHTIFQALQTLDFWLLFFSFLCGVGTGLAVINNLGQIGQSLGYNSVAIFISLTSIWGFFGRIGSGTLTEYGIRRAGIPRPTLMAASQLLMIAGYILLAIAAPGSLYIGATVVGICYGVRLAVSVPTASELFGLKYFGLMYNILILNLPLGSFLFSGLLAGFIYDHEARKQHNITNTTFTYLNWIRQAPKFLGQDDNLDLAANDSSRLGTLTCIGVHCYRKVFLVMALVCGVGFAFDVLLSFRSRKLYANGRKSRRGERAVLS